MLIALWLSLFCQTGSAAPKLEVPKELRYERRIIADSENAFKQLELAASQFIEPTGNANYEKISAAEGDWIDDAALNQFCEDHAANLELMQQAAQLKFLQFPEMQSSEESLPYLGPLRALARYEIVEAKRQYAKKNHAACARHLANVVRIGDLMMHGDGVLIHYLVGVAVKSIGLSGVRWLTTKPDVPTKVLLDLNAKIELLDGDRGALADAYRVEFHKCALPMLARMKENPIETLQHLQQLNDETNDPKDSGERYEALNRNPKPFDYQASFVLCANFYHELVVASEDRYSKEYRLRTERNLTDLAKQLHSPAKVATTPNAAGIMFMALVAPPFNSFQFRAARTEITTGCSRLLLALRAYVNDNIDLPASIDQLVPKYLKSIPVDSFDGKPLRYSKADKKVFSVGPEPSIEFAVKLTTH